MANRKATFAKRQREMDLKDHAKAKAERRAQRMSQPRDQKGPEIAWDAVFVPEAPTVGEVTDAPDPVAADAPTNPSPASAAPAPNGAPKPHAPHPPHAAPSATTPKPT